MVSLDTMTEEITEPVETTEWITISTKIKKENAEIFRQLCTMRETTPSAVIAQIINNEVVLYGLGQADGFNLFIIPNTAPPIVVDASDPIVQEKIAIAFSGWLPQPI